MKKKIKIVSGAAPHTKVIIYHNQTSHYYPSARVTCDSSDNKDGRMKQDGIFLDTHQYAVHF